MLIGISPLISPELIAILHRMGHGDTLVIADAFFPGDTCNARVARADGIRAAPLLDAILALINPDAYTPSPFIMMAPVPGDTLDPRVEESYSSAITKRYPDAPAITRVARQDFYDLAKRAFAVVVTGETAKYGNILLQKGVIPV